MTAGDVTFVCVIAAAIIVAAFGAATWSWIALLVLAGFVFAIA